MSNSINECGCNHAGMFLDIPHTRNQISPGCKVRLGRFSDDTWTVNFGWFSFSGNRPMCGWYFTSDDGEKVKPILLTDLDDIYMIEH